MGPGRSKGWGLAGLRGGGLAGLKGRCLAGLNGWGPGRSKGWGPGREHIPLSFNVLPSTPPDRRSRSHLPPSPNAPANGCCLPPLLLPPPPPLQLGSLRKKIMEPSARYETPPLDLPPRSRKGGLAAGGRRAQGGEGAGGDESTGRAALLLKVKGVAWERGWGAGGGVGGWGVCWWVSQTVVYGRGGQVVGGVTSTGGGGEGCYWGWGGRGLNGGLVVVGSRALIVWWQLDPPAAGKPLNP